MNKRDIGNKYENLACEFLLSNNVKVIDRNFRNRFGEIDIIGIDENSYIVFIEVKYRKNPSMGLAVESVSLKKAKQIQKIANYYIYLNSLFNKDVRFDIVAIDDDKVTWIKDAF